MIAACALSLAIWIYLLFGRGYFWRVRRHLLPKTVPPGEFPPPRVIAVIPARDEAAFIGHAVRSILAGKPVSHLIVVDDASTDGTADEAGRAAVAIGQAERLTVLRGKPLEAGWTGKLWALAQGVEHAISFAPDYLLLTDADVVHEGGELSSLVSLAEQSRSDLASLMVMLHCETPAEKMLIPAFVYFFLQLYPPAWIASSRRKTAGAAGGCLLIRTIALERMGGLAAIRGEVIDDCSLARAVKRSGGRIWMKLASQTRSLRPYGGFSEIGQMIARTAFSQLRHSPVLLLATIAGMTLVYLIPVCGVFVRNPVVLALAWLTWLAMATTFLPMVRFYGRSGGWCIALPLIAVFYLGATVFSALQYWAGKGGRWKGRSQDARTRS